MAKVSIIIPACNEENYIKKTIDSLRTQSYKNVEIIVVVNGSTDKTAEIAKKYADKSLCFSAAIGPGKARNEGTKIAKGDIFVFLDADTQLSKNVIESIVACTKVNTFGTCLGKPDKKGLRAKLFFTMKNYLHRLRIYKGFIDGFIFCHRELFLKTNGIDPKFVGEFYGFIKRAIRSGGKYKFLKNCYIIVSTRRYEQKGYFRIIWFWIKWGMNALFKKGGKVAKKYKQVR